MQVQRVTLRRCGNSSLCTTRYIQTFDLTDLGLCIFSLHLTLQEFMIVLTYDSHSEAKMQIDAIMLQEQFKLQKAPKVQ